MALSDLRTSLGEFPKDKVVWWHVVLWLFGLYILVQLFGFKMGGEMPGVLLVPYSFNFMLHEWSHILTGFLPPILSAAAGSGSELLLGLGLVIGAIWFKNWFALMFCLLWFDLALQSAGGYMADAVVRKLPLVSLGGALSGQDATHDWNFIFGQLHLLGASEFIGNSLRLFGHVVGIFALLFAAYLIVQMIIFKRAEKSVRQPERSWEKLPTSTATKSIYAEPTKGALAYNKPQDKDKDLENRSNF